MPQDSKDASRDASRNSRRMGHVIVTARSLAWLLLSLVALMAVLGALVSPRWIVAAPGKPFAFAFLSA